MTQEERIKSLASLYCHYMTKYHDAVRKLYKTVKKDEETVDVVVATCNVNRIDRVCIDPILRLLQEEDVQYIEEENGKTVIHMRDYRKFTIDEAIGNPFKVEFPIDYVYEDD